MKLPEKKRNPGRKTCPGTSLSTINPTQSGQVCNRWKIRDSHVQCENVSFVIIIIYEHFPKKGVVNAESYLIAFSQSVYRLRSPDKSVLSGNTINHVQ